MMTRNTMQAIACLTDRFGDQLSTADAVRRHHATGVTAHRTEAPDAVLFARATADVVDAVRICHEHRCPVVPFGTGTSTEGQISAEQGGVTIDLSGMNRILRVSPDDLDCTVEAGVTRKTLNASLRDTGLFFPVDPGADASIGGMASTRASGTNAVRYGTMRDVVMSLSVVLADGQVIETGTRARKSSAGYDLTRLFVGAEGTLGVITEVTLRLHGLPEAMAVATCAFATIDGAVKTAIEVIQLGLGVARIEFMDDRLVQAINTYSRIELPVYPTLLFEFHGISKTTVAETARLAEQLAAEHDGLGFTWETTPAGRERLWTARHSAYYASRALRPGSEALTTDVCVPISRLAECIVTTRSEIEVASFTATMVGHVGDGNFHVLC